MAQDLYWPKMDPSLYQVGIIIDLHVHFPQCPFDQGHERLDPYGQGLMDPTRFHQQFAEDLRHQVNFVTFIIILIAIVILMTLMQGPYGMGGGSWGDPSKASSAFSPINSGVGLPTSTGLYFLPFHSQSTSCLSFPSPQGSTWEALGGVIPSTTQSHSKDKARLANPFKISIHLELKRLDLIQLASPPLVGSLISHGLVKQRLRKVNSSPDCRLVLKRLLCPGWV